MFWNYHDFTFFDKLNIPALYTSAPEHHALTESKGELVPYLRKLPVKASDPTCLSETHDGCLACGLITPGVVSSYQNMGMEMMRYQYFDV